MAVEYKPYAGPEHLPFEFGEGPGAALLIHGFPGTPAEMRPLGRALNEDGWRTKGILLPGFGPEIIELNNYGRKDWIAAAEKAWLEIYRADSPTILIGYSMGAAVALNLAGLHSPDLLVLISPFWHVPGLLPRLVPVLKWLIPEFRPFEQADFSQPELRAMFQQIIPEADLSDPAVQDDIRAEFTLSLQLIDDILTLGRGAYRTAGRITAQALVIQGRRDQVVQPADTRKLVARFPTEHIVYDEVEGAHDLIQNGSVNRAEVNARVIQQAAKFK
ncbi:MAG: alpha/beta fold hydrolase [Anaerolineales bacterium]|nr:alpha/beta fold hydrolase [Anaerolineales bacterium]